MSVSTISGLQKHFDRLDPKQIQKAAKAGIWAGANEIKVEAQLSITRGSVSGANHVASKPGEPPNNDTGVLKNNIETVSTGPLTAEVQSKAPYAVIQEYGGTIDHPGGQPFFKDKNGDLVFVSKNNPRAAKMAKTKPHKITLPERPYMRPAAKKMKPVVAAIVKDRLDNTLKRKG